MEGERTVMHHVRETWKIITCAYGEFSENTNNPRLPGDFKYILQHAHRNRKLQLV